MSFSRLEGAGAGTATGAGIGYAVGGPLGAYLGAWGGTALGSLFGKKKKSLSTGEKLTKFAQSYPSQTIEGINRGINPVAYNNYKPMFDLTDQYTEAWDAANAATESRYQQGLTGWSDLVKMYEGYDPKVPTDVNTNYGEGQRAAIEQQRKEGTAASLQTLASSGLANSTVAPAIQAQYRSLATNQLIDLEDTIAQYNQSRADRKWELETNLAQNKMDNIASATQGKLNWIGNKTDVGPDSALFSQMMQLYSSKPGLFNALPALAEKNMLKTAYNSLGK